MKEFDNYKRARIAQMRVELVAKSEMVGEMGRDGDLAFLGEIASICYGHKNEGRYETIAKSCARMGHSSILEHMCFTFYIGGISRACAQQLTRHRLASYTMESQRYKDVSTAGVVLGPSLEGGGDHIEDIVGLISQTLIDTYADMVKAGVRKEDARGILPINLETELYMTLNLRQLLHMLEVRDDGPAQGEIRQLVQMMRDEVMEAAPTLAPLFLTDEVMR